MQEKEWVCTGRVQRVRFELGPSRVPGMSPWRWLVAQEEARALGHSTPVERRGGRQEDRAEGRSPAVADSEGMRKSFVRPEFCSQPPCARQCVFLLVQNLHPMSHRLGGG